MLEPSASRRAGRCRLTDWSPFPEGAGGAERKATLVAVLVNCRSPELPPALFAVPELPPRLLLRRAGACDEAALREVRLQHAVGVVAQLGQAQLVVGAAHDVERFLDRRGLRIGGDGL